MIVIISGMSGSGKTTLVNALLAKTTLPMFKVVTYTTRPMREGERDGVDYHFITKEEFKKLYEAGKFCESALVYDKHYGTPWMNDKSGIPVLITDIQGFRTLRDNMPPELYLSVFITSSNYQQRLLARNTESKEALARRLEIAHEEERASAEYDYIIKNDNLEEALGLLETRIEWVLKHAT